MRHLRKLALAAVAALVPFAAVRAEPTTVDVRVISQGAKFIGSSMGGVLVTLRDADTGELLASGLTEGGTGDTEIIMKTAHKRGEAVLSDEGAAKFSATLDIEEPVRVEATATGPMAQRQAAQTVSATRWVLPGVGLTGGDGWLMEMPGLMVDVLAPAAAHKFGDPQDAVRIEANVTMMCGCPLAPEKSPWDSDDYKVVAHVARNGEAAGDVPLDYAGTRSLFAGEVDTSSPGLYVVTVTAHDAENGNAGLDTVTFAIPKPEKAAE